MVTWDTIDCIERNGVITSYSVEFQEEGGAGIPGEVMGQSFTASGLTPNTSYTFRVAGVNANGTGPFTETITISTDTMIIIITEDVSSNTGDTTTNKELFCGMFLLIGIFFPHQFAPNYQGATFLS